MRSTILAALIAAAITPAYAQLPRHRVAGPVMPAPHIDSLADPFFPMTGYRFVGLPDSIVIEITTTPSVLLSPRASNGILTIPVWRSRGPSIYCTVQTLTVSAILEETRVFNIDKTNFRPDDAIMFEDWLGYTTKFIVNGKEVFARWPYAGSTPHQLAGYKNTCN